MLQGVACPMIMKFFQQHSRLPKLRLKVNKKPLGFEDV